MNSEKHCIVLGVTGGIGAYKAADLTSKLVRHNFDVHVLMTANAQKLVTALTFQTLSRNPVVTDLWTLPQWRPGHVALAERAELLIVVPCTANFIGKLANGIADDALSTYAVTHDRKIMIAPAMNPKMWQNPAVQRNVALLRERGVELIGPVEGHVACGADGAGRLVEAADIFTRIAAFFAGEESGNDGV